MKELNLHGFELTDAIIEIHFAIQECINEGDKIIELIHGYHSGSVLKNYIQSKKFIDHFQKEGFKLKRIKASNQGTTRFQIL